MMMRMRGCGCNSPPVKSAHKSRTEEREREGWREGEENNMEYHEESRIYIKIKLFV